MKNRFALTAAFLVANLFAIGQKATNILELKSGSVAISPNISTLTIDSLNRKIAGTGRAFLIIQFDELPTEIIKRQLSLQGIELLNYIPDNAYSVSVNAGLNANILQQAKARAIIQPTARQKMDVRLAQGNLPASSIIVPGTIDVWISVSKAFDTEEVVALLNKMNIEILSSAFASYHVFSLRIAVNQIFDLADQPFVEYVSPAPSQEQPLVNNSKSLARANVLNASVANGGKGLKGEGVTIGIGDDADIQYHIDFTGRLINNTSAPQSTHGTHVSGIAAGGGLVNESLAGFAPKATIISNTLSRIIENSPAYVEAYHMVATNNSYGSMIGCENNGIYDLASAILDQQAFDLPYLQHVFASGNSGDLSCSPYPSGFKTVLGGFQSAKNILCVGNTDIDGVLAVGSSRGPVRDGRIKPEITAMGRDVLSTWPGNIYVSDRGTSMAAPAVTGGAALLYQRYRQLHAGADPKSALIKAVLCNGANDRGNPGPDFKYGFGSMNLLRSVNMLEQADYFSNTISNGSIQNYSIAVPANTAKLKVMLYWHDPASSPLAAKALVNDLDLELINSSSATSLPLILDSTVNHVNDIALTGADHANNVEQVVMDSPAAGTYTIRIKGTAIAQNPSQEYFVVYDIIPNSIQLTYPVGGEGIAPGETVRIAWDSYGDEGSTFHLQYSTDAGNTWNDIVNNFAAGVTTVYTWNVPAIATEKALIRVIKEATGQTSTSNLFTIIGVPAISFSAVQCEGYINIDWNTIPAATDYEIMMLKGDEMASIATTTNTSYSINSLSKDSIYLVSVRARINGKAGRRAYGITRQPSDGNCAGTISDNDLKLNAIISPVSGRKFTSSQLSATTPVVVEIKNLDDAPVTGFAVKYSIDGGTNWTSENSTATIAPGSVYSYTFSTTENLSAPGVYNLVAVVTNNNVDAATGNDTIKTIVKHIDNQPINLSTTFLDNLETANVNTYRSDTIGLGGAERYDFRNNNVYGRLRPFVYANSGMAYSGSKAFTMDVDRMIVENNTNHLIGTFNLSNYNTPKELRLDFRFAVHGLNVRDSSKVWIRGSDANPWIEVYNLWDNRGPYGVYKLSSSIEIGDSLLKYGQDFSSSFQIKWSQYCSNKAVQKNSAGGLSIDDIRLYEALGDVQMLSIDTPASFNCGLNASTPLKVTIRNSNLTGLNNLPVRYSINGGAWITETVAAIAGETTIQYTFTSKLNLANPGTYVIKAIVDYPTDNVRDNDTAVVNVQNFPLINSFPHIENFEAGNGGWYANGVNSSWAYGTPASAKINRAASGAKAWKTNLSGNYHDEEISYLYSPCYQIGGLAHPALSFSAAFDMEDCGTTVCDWLSLQYSTDGKEWLLLKDSMATNGYNAPTKNYWSVQDYTRWHVVTVALPKPGSTIRFRFAFGSDPAVTREGVAIDDIHVYDSTKAIYDGPTTASPVSQNIAGGTNWMHFEKDGKLIASVQPNNQNLGVTNVQAFIHSAAVRNNGTQYYHNRNITIKPAQSAIADSATIRFYFLDSETEALINATGCAGCNKPASAYELGVSQYDDYDTSFENGSIADDLQGLWTFINSNKATIVPFGKGYYTEFKVKDFSEFWLNKGVLNNTTLPVKLFSFSVQKTGTEDVTVSWVVGTENNVARYEIELARTDVDVQNNNFQKIGEVAGRGNSTLQQQYSFIDSETFKTGVRYYRIKTVNLDGSFSLSIVRSVVFNTVVNWQVVPNPSSGLFYLVYQANSGEMMKMRIIDAIGRAVKTYSIKGNGFIQKLPVDLSANVYAPGIYMLQLEIDGKLQTFKLYKQ